MPSLNLSAFGRDLGFDTCPSLEVQERPAQPIDGPLVPQHYQRVVIDDWTGELREGPYAALESDHGKGHRIANRPMSPMAPGNPARAKPGTIWFWG
jgi:hypothetical protein